MSDVFNVTASYNKASYVPGETIVVTVSGTNTHSGTTTATAGPLVIPVVANPSGAQSTVNVPSVLVTITGTTVEAVKIDTTQPIVDSSPTPRSWTVSGDGLSISATA